MSDRAPGTPGDHLEMERNVSCFQAKLAEHSGASSPPKPRPDRLDWPSLPALGLDGPSPGRSVNLPIFIQVVQTEVDQPGGCSDHRFALILSGVHFREVAANRIAAEAIDSRFMNLKKAARIRDFRPGQAPSSQTGPGSFSLAVRRGEHRPVREVGGESHKIVCQCGISNSGNRGGDSCGVPGLLMDEQRDKAFGIREKSSELPMKMPDWRESQILEGGSVLSNRCGNRGRHSRPVGIKRIAAWIGI